MIRTIVKTETLEITMPAMRPLMKFGKFIECRKASKMSVGKFKKCICCDYEFKDDDDIYIAQVKGKCNLLACEKCIVSEEGEQGED